MSEFQNLLEAIQKRQVWVYEQLNEDNPKEAKANFLANPELRWPNFVHEEKKVKKLFEQYNDLDALYCQIQDSDCSVAEKTLLEQMRQFGMKSNEQALKAILHACPEKEAGCLLVKYGCLPRVSGCLLCDWEESKVTLRNRSCEFYGYKINMGLMGALLHETLEEVTDGMDHWTEVEREVLDEIVDLLEKYELTVVWRLNPDQKALIYRPDSEVVFKFGQLAEQKLEPLLSCLSHRGDTYASDELKDIANDIYATVYPESGFSAEINESGTGFAVYQKERIFKIPRHRARGEVDYATLYSVFGGHEIAVHIGRGIPYVNTELAGFVTGFTNYEATEEGIAKCVEKSLRMLVTGNSESDDHVAMDYYVNIALAHFRAMDFRDLWTFRRDVMFLINVKNGMNQTEAMERAVNATYAQVRRVFRGTGDVIDYKDLFYYVEEEHIWKVITDYIDRPEELWFTLMGLGKINIFDAGTQFVLAEILDSDSFPKAKAKLLEGKILTDILVTDAADRVRLHYCPN